MLKLIWIEYSYIKLACLARTQIKCYTSSHDRKKKHIIRCFLIIRYELHMSHTEGVKIGHFQDKGSILFKSQLLKVSKFVVHSQGQNLNRKPTKSLFRVSLAVRVESLFRVCFQNLWWLKEKWPYFPVRIDSRDLQMSNVYQFEDTTVWERWHFLRSQINIDYSLIQCIRGFCSYPLPIFNLSLQVPWIDSRTQFPNISEHVPFKWASFNL